MTNEHPNHKPAHTVIGCVTLIVAIAFGIGACTALTSSNDAPEQDATPDPAVESVEPADEDTADTEMTAEDITTLALDITWEQKTHRAIKATRSRAAFAIARQISKSTPMLSILPTSRI